METEFCVSWISKPCNFTMFLFSFFVDSMNQKYFHKSAWSDFSEWTQSLPEWNREWKQCKWKDNFGLRASPWAMSCASSQQAFQSGDLESTVSITRHLPLWSLMLLSYKFIHVIWDVLSVLGSAFVAALCAKTKCTRCWLSEVFHSQGSCFFRQWRNSRMIDSAGANAMKVTLIAAQ